MEQNNSNFLREQIKDRPINKKKLMRRTFITAAMAVVFALVACLVFTVLEPVLSNWMYPEKEPEIITFPEEENEILPEDMLTDKEEEEQQVSLSPSYEETEGIVDQQISAMFASFKLDVDDYKTMYSALGLVAEEAARSMVTVTGVKSDVDWFDNVYQSKGQTSGIIIGENGKQLLILAQKSVSDKAESIVITFVDGQQCLAECKASDVNTGLAVYTVPLENLQPGTTEQIKIAELGSSINTKLVGMPVIAIGSPMGTAGSVGYGMITSANGSISMRDTSYKLLNTDIYGSQNATGVLINLKGQVLGVIDCSRNGSDMKNMISAIGITELKQIIEKISNGIPVAYLGVHLADVPQMAHDEQGVPYGAYVTSIEMGSPAMEVGIQSGDVIIRFGETPINNSMDLSKCIYRTDAQTQVELLVQRKGPEEYREMTLTLTLGILE